MFSSQLGVVTERDHWIGAGGAKCGNVTGEQSDGREGDGNENKCRRVKRADAVKQSGKSPGREKSEDKADRGSDSDKLERVADDKP